MNIETISGFFYVGLGAVAIFVAAAMWVWGVCQIIGTIFPDFLQDHYGFFAMLFWDDDSFPAMMAAIFAFLTTFAAFCALFGFAITEFAGLFDVCLVSCGG